MRLVKDMSVGEVGYCVDWVITGDEINGEYSVGPQRREGRGTKICRYSKITFSVHLSSGRVLARLKEAKEPCIFKEVINAR